ncbi:ECF transporter S component [Natroniella acetigena]|uniref:ECF transporter S component n=1 Tax=Natroniella acetigena TaxID=52004 RepID=UPI00200B4087|nr:ECF transporter S component [Natroniella acetigena]MCK8827496.1 ECF transporter S component [Natroniella acetigena]
MNLSTRTITITGILSAITIILAVTPLGFIPTPFGLATIMPVPVIIGAIIEGPIVGGLIGLIFGLFSFIRAGSPFIADPIVAIIPRVLIGFLAAYSYKLINQQLIGSGIAAAVGFLTNTGGVLTLSTLRGYLTAEAALGIAVIHGIPELVVGVVTTLLIFKVLQRTQVSN